MKALCPMVPLLLPNTDPNIPLCCRYHGPLWIRHGTKGKGWTKQIIDLEAHARFRATEMMISSEDSWALSKFWSSQSPWGVVQNGKWYRLRGNRGDSGVQVGLFSALPCQPDVLVVVVGTEGGPRESCPCSQFCPECFPGCPLPRTHQSFSRVVFLSCPKHVLSSKHKHGAPSPLQPVVFIVYLPHVGLPPILWPCCLELRITTL